MAFVEKTPEELNTMFAEMAESVDFKSTNFEKTCQYLMDSRVLNTLGSGAFGLPHLVSAAQKAVEGVRGIRQGAPKEQNIQSFAQSGVAASAYVTKMALGAAILLGAKGVAAIAPAAKLGAKVVAKGAAKGLGVMASTHEAHHAEVHAANVLTEKICDIFGLDKEKMVKEHGHGPASLKGALTEVSDKFSHAKKNAGNAHNAFLDYSKELLEVASVLKTGKPSVSNQKTPQHH